MHRGVLESCFQCCTVCCKCRTIRCNSLSMGLSSVENGNRNEYGGGGVVVVVVVVMVGGGG